MSQTISEKLSDFVAGFEATAIPAEVRDKARWLVLDTIGTCAGSLPFDYGGSIGRLVAGWGGAPEATLIGGRARAPAHAAALCNGVLAHAQDYDDTHTEAVVHSSAALVPAALAVSEACGAPGKAMLDAFILGTEVAIRIALPARNGFHRSGFHTTSVATTFGACAIACRLWGMSVEETVAAFGSCGSVLPGLVECVPAGASAKRLHAGWAAHAGISAAHLARAGYAGPRTILDGKFGVYNSMLKDPQVDLAQVTASLGARWEMLDVRPKVYPCCHYLQAFVDCAAQLRTSGAVEPQAVAAIKCRVASGAVPIVCEPWEKKLNPVDAYAAKFSLPFAVCVMLARGKAGSEEFSASGIADPRVHALMSKVSYEVDPAYQVKDMPAWIEITTTHGERRRFDIPVVYGDRSHPIAPEALLMKYFDNTAAWPRARAEEVVRVARELDALDDVRRLGALLAA